MRAPRSESDRVRAAWTAAAIIASIAMLSTFTLALPEEDPTAALGGVFEPVPNLPRAGEPPPGDLPPAEGTGVPVAAPEPGRPAPAPGPDTGPRYDCARGQNAGATDIGITADEVRFAATVVRSGIARDFLQDAQWGMEAVIQKVNRAGGICGRRIHVTYRDDGWDPSRGGRIIQQFIDERRYFGLAVNPSSEGLRGPIDSGVISQHGFPVLGADGMLINQYLDPWVWPVATSTSSIMHIMAHDAYARGARTFGIVWENNFRFGVEGHAAFTGAVGRLGGEMKSDVAIQGGQTDYSNAANQFIRGCGGRDTLSDCDFIAMLLEPNTASQWVRNGGLGDGRARPRIGIGAPQPLFLDAFARDCGQFCANMWVWTSFNPPIPPFDTQPAVRTYLEDLRAVSATADPVNPHVQGAYVGMRMVVEALEALGPAPTRQGLREVLDGFTLETGLTTPLTFRDGNRFAAVSGQAFEAVVNNNVFTNWRYANTGFLTDPDVGRDIPER